MMNEEYYNVNRSIRAGRFFTVCVLVLSFTLIFAVIIEFKGYPVYFFNLKAYTITSSSMEPDFKVNSLVIIKRGDFSDVQEGDIIAFKAAALGGKSALHRVVRVTSDGVYTMGDNGKHADNQLITRSEYIGKAVFHTNIFADYFTKLKKTDGVLVYFIFPLIALSAFVCAIKVLTDKKKPCKRQAVVFLIFKGPPRY